MRMNWIALWSAACLAALPLSLPAQDVPVEKPWEATAGAMLWQGDHQDAGIETGFMGGLDYYLRGTESAIYGVGVRGIFGSGDGTDSTTLGAHLILRGAFSQAGGAGAAMFYKIAAGLYWTEINPAVGVTADEIGFGGSASIGYDFSMTDGAAGTPFSIEVGWFFGPSVDSVDNNGFFALAGVRF